MKVGMGFPWVSAHTIAEQKKSGKDAQVSDNKEKHPVPPNYIQSWSPFFFQAGKVESHLSICE